MLKDRRPRCLRTLLMLFLLAMAEGASANQLDSYLTSQLDQARIPGLSAAIVKGGKVVWSGSYGWSRYQNQEVTGETLFQLASVSKAVTGVAVMKTWENGRLDLDEDINTYLPFRVVNPKFPHHPITIRMLLTHTSSIRDYWKVLESLYVWGDDSSISLSQFLESYLTPGGDHYHSAYNFFKGEPGTAFHYSNVGAALAAYLVEAVTGIPFDVYCSLEIFEPLGMKETSWRLADLDLSRLAMPYQYGRYDYFSDSSPSSSGLEDRIGCFLVEAHLPRPPLTFSASSHGSPYHSYSFSASGQGSPYHSSDFHAYGFYAYPDYPDGLLKTSAPQLARFLAMFIQDGMLEGVRILEPETVEEMKRVQNPGLDPQQGLIWYYKRLSGWTLLGHSGEDLGTATEMFFRPEDGAGVILLMNGDWSAGNERIIAEIEARLFRESGAF